MSVSPPFDVDTLAGSIDAILLAPQLTESETIAGCMQAKNLGLASVVVKPCYVRQAVNALRVSQVAVGTVIGFPHGGNTSHIKLSEAKRALTEGALELVFMGNLGYLKAGSFDQYREDLKGVVGLTHMNGAKVKVLLEMGYLSEAEALAGIEEAVRLNADWVVASTGFCPNGATLRDAKAVITALDGRAQAAVMDGVENVHDLLVFIDAGCTRVGISDPGRLLANPK
jgi:deoxyribose-phosphate aldolase